MKTILSLLMVMILSQAIFAQGYRVNRTNEKKGNVKKLDLGKNIISFTPAQVILTNSHQSNPDIAVGLSYERILNNGLIGIKLPLSFSISNTNSLTNQNGNPYMYFNPTIKLYPKGQGVVKYAVGPQFLIAGGKTAYYQNIYNSSTGGFTSNFVSGNRVQFGFLINNSINFTLIKNLYMGIDAGLGLIYYDNMPQAGQNYNPLSSYYNYNNNTSSVNPAFQINFNMGFRF